ncbi:hypothetical protein JXA27_06680 [Aerococcaceae bacterium zg-B36]|uniref:hypothetical protein n=1 Tax=Aerococcaceae bacterium zg-252 TaxID=2796928 RepID=UPI001BD86188|nr:hypothetical protein [Aerococcaceae bacterium zg-B36]
MNAIRDDYALFQRMFLEDFVSENYDSFVNLAQDNNWSYRQCLLRGRQLQIANGVVKRLVSSVKSNGVLTHKMVEELFLNTKLFDETVQYLKNLIDRYESDEAESVLIHLINELGAHTVDKITSLDFVRLNNFGK